MSDHDIARGETLARSGVYAPPKDVSATSYDEDKDVSETAYEHNGQTDDIADNHGDDWLRAAAHKQESRIRRHAYNVLLHEMVLRMPKSIDIRHAEQIVGLTERYTPGLAREYNHIIGEELAQLVADKRVTHSQDFSGREAWFADINGAQLLDDIKHFLTRFIAYPHEWAVTAHTLWIAHTHLMDCWESTPRIAFLSPEPSSGKTRALEVTEPLVPRPIHAVNTTPAYLFRKVSDPDGAPTLLYDEIDTVFGPKAKENEDIRGMLNAGHRKGAVAGRCVVRGVNVDTEDLPAYCAVALAGLDDLPDTIMSRSIVIRMQRRAPTETVQPWRHRINTPEGARLCFLLRHWATSVTFAAEEQWPNMPAGVEDRNADVWEPLLAVADLAGGHWPNTARVAAVAAVADSKAATQSLGVLLLRDMRTVFSNNNTDRLCSASVLTNLKAIEESPWNNINRDGSALNPRGLGKRLSRYGIKSDNMRDDTGKVVKGYLRAQFTDAWLRYLTDDDQDSGKHEDEHSDGDNDTLLFDLPSSRMDAATPATSATSHDSGEHRP